MRHLFPVLVSGFLLATGCGPSAPTIAVKNNRLSIDYVSADSLAMTYINRQQIYTNRMVQIRVMKGGYRVRNGYITCHNCGTNDLIRFETDNPPPTEDFDLTVTGTCRGTVQDGVIRCDDPRIDWYIRIESCSVAVNP